MYRQKKRLRSKFSLFLLHLPSICLVIFSELNFINILRAAFTREDPKCVKMILKLSIFLMLFGSTSGKASRETLMKQPHDSLHIILCLYQLLPYDCRTNVRKSLQFSVSSHRYLPVLSIFSEQLCSVTTTLFLHFSKHHFL